MKIVKTISKRRIWFSHDVCVWIYFISIQCLNSIMQKFIKSRAHFNWHQFTIIINVTIYILILFLKLQKNINLIKIYIYHFIFLCLWLFVVNRKCRVDIYFTTFPTSFYFTGYIAIMSAESRWFNCCFYWNNLLFYKIKFNLSINVKWIDFFFFHPKNQ